MAPLLIGLWWGRSSTVEVSAEWSCLWLSESKKERKRPKRRGWRTRCILWRLPSVTASSDWAPSESISSCGLTGRFIHITCPDPTFEHCCLEEQACNTWVFRNHVMLKLLRMGKLTYLLHDDLLFPVDRGAVWHKSKHTALSLQILILQWLPCSLLIPSF